MTNSKCYKFFDDDFVTEMEEKNTLHNTQHLYKIQ